MATLKSLADGREIRVASRLRIGRAPDAGLVISRPVVSMEHATVRWSGDVWEVRDLGSRNGTFVDGRPIAAGEPIAIDLGSRLAFGDLEEAWEVTEAEPPSVFATPRGGGELALGREGLLVLPSAERPELSVYRAAHGGWIAELDDGEQRPVEDGTALEAGGETWVVTLPDVIEGTPAYQTSPTLDTIALRFQVSRDEEQVTISVVHRGRVTALEPHWHGYVLLTLARLRQEAADRPEPERGWVERDRLLRMLRMDANNLNVAIHKAREQLLEAGILGASGVVEVRRGQRRFGTDRFEITREP